MSDTNILVIDVGTSSLRGVLVNSQGKMIFTRQVEYDVICESDTVVSQDPADWANALTEVCRCAADFGREKGLAIGALSMTSQRSSVIPVDEKGNALQNAIMWQDKRNASIVEELKPHSARIHRKTGARLNTVFSGTKMTWIRRNQPDIYEKAYKLLTVADYLTHIMTGEFRTDHTYGSRSLLMDVRTRQWDDELLELFEVEREKLCQLVEPGSAIGTVTAEFARRTGLEAGVPLISAGGDQQCAAVGHGVIRPGTMEITTGTGAFILGFSEKVPENLGTDVIFGAHSVPGRYVLESSMLTCAALYNWLGRNFCSADGHAAAVGELNRLAEEAPAGCHGCIALPYFQGRGTPDWNAGAKGGFLNLTLQTTKADMVRAILEAIAFEACNNVRILEGYAGAAETIYIGGGLTKFAMFNQIQADVYQRQLRRSENSEQAVMGAWVIGAVTMGMFSSYENALKQAQQGIPMSSYQPSGEHAALYQSRNEEMNRIYRALYSVADSAPE